MFGYVILWLFNGLSFSPQNIRERIFLGEEEEVPMDSSAEYWLNKYCKDEQNQ